MADFTSTQGRYLAFIHAYTVLHGYPPAESEIATALCISPPSVNQMVKMLEKKGLILRQPGRPRSLQVLIPEDEIPPWNGRKQATIAAPLKYEPRRVDVAPVAPPANLYVVSVFLQSGPTSKKFTNKEISRVIEIRGDQTLEQLHKAIFQAYDRSDEHLYEFQFGKRPFDPNGHNYGVPSPHESKQEDGDARTTKLDDLSLKPGRAFGYWFDFGDDWYHQVQVDQIERPSRLSPLRVSSGGWANLRRSIATNSRCECENDVELEEEMVHRETAYQGWSKSGQERVFIQLTRT